jgi:hypothetical protein
MRLSGDYKKNENDEIIRATGLDDTKKTRDSIDRNVFRLRSRLQKDREIIHLATQLGTELAVAAGFANTREDGDE